MSLVGAIAFIQTTLGSISGIKSAPSQPPESSNAYPFAITYPDSGQVELEFQGADKQLHNIAIEVHFNRANLPTAIELMTPMIKSVADIFKTYPDLNGTVDTVVATASNRITYTLSSVEYAGVMTLALRFVVTVKIRE